MIERIASGVVIVTLATIVAFVAWSGLTLATAEASDTRTFDLTGVAASGVWTLETVSGLNYWWKRFEPATLWVTTGDEVVLSLRSADVFHNFYLPEFAVGPVEVEPGHTVTVRFRASRAGVFQYYCTSMCGTCHFYMRGWLVVTDAGKPPIDPPPLVCGICMPPQVEVPADLPLVHRGQLLYEQRGCFTCHGPEGRGGVGNDNSTNGSVPNHDTTAEKFFLLTEDDADEFIRLMETSEDLAAVTETDITAFPVVRTRFLNAKEIVRRGRFTARADPQRPQPPLQMPAWQHLLSEREIDALLVYFVSLEEWEEDE